MADQVPSKEQAHRVRYIVARIEADGSWLVGLDSNRPLETGWYRLIVDDDGRQAFEAGPFDTAEKALCREASALVEKA